VLGIKAPIPSMAGFNCDEIVPRPKRLKLEENSTHQKSLGDLASLHTIEQNAEKTFDSTIDCVSDTHFLALQNTCQDELFGGPSSIQRARRRIEEIPDSDTADGSDTPEIEAEPHLPTELESALPPVKTDKEAIAEYETLRYSNHHGKDRNWVSSIYVDAFNLALDTVLGDESHLFNESEMGVFRVWRDLDYETQYLSVP